jgi:hypothetical protein
MTALYEYGNKITENWLFGLKTNYLDWALIVYKLEKSQHLDQSNNLRVLLLVLFIFFTLATSDCLYHYEPRRNAIWDVTDSDSQRTNPSAGSSSCDNRTSW